MKESNRRTHSRALRAAMAGILAGASFAAVGCEKSSDAATATAAADTNGCNGPNGCSGESDGKGDTTKKHAEANADAR
jgi:hypothetical protein